MSSPVTNSMSVLPELPYSLHTRKGSIATQWGTLLLPTCILTLILYFAIKHDTHVHEDIALTVSTAILGVFTIATFIPRTCKFSKKTSSSRPVDASRWSCDYLTWNLLLGTVVATAVLAPATGDNPPNVRQASMPQAVVLYFASSRLLITGVLCHLGWTTPITLSSTKRKQPARPGVFVLIEDVVAVDGGGGTLYREVLIARYEASPYFRTLLRQLNWFWGLGSFAVALMTTILIYTVESEDAAFGLGTDVTFTRASSTIDYTSLEASPRPLSEWNPAQLISVTKPRNPDWHWGSGNSDAHQGLENHVEIDPYEEGRPMAKNYTLLISGIAPRPIGLTSTISAEGKPNLAPFSYFQIVDHDPPVFMLAFSGRSGVSKDTLRNLRETGEAVLNTVSENMIEAVNATSVDAPHGVSEWVLSGLTKVPSTTVKPARVKEAVFSIETKLLKIVDFDASEPSQNSHGCLALLEATRFWVREDAIDEQKRHIDLEKLRPVGQLGGIAYSRVTDTFELPRSSWDRATKETPELVKLRDDESL
ncbi:hypothetical protein E4T52_12910 [Aureobasidium sp. EXF-3400]|nr:hypothetical protein E4T51_12856 [Aureobasidium sp. EXF-12344]KAI4772107.1 hypothetical protein E4T52_12910 [Aureobasidium sp. EXF-3400]